MSAQINSDLLVAIEVAYKPSGLTCKNVMPEAESQEYGACDFELQSLRIKFRAAKITPTKVGQFVTLWKRVGSGQTMPHDIADPFDFFVISVRSGENLGQFVFPKAVLAENGIVSKNGSGGKRGIRVYPPWDVTDSPQAKKSQAWQLLYFFKINSAGTVRDVACVKIFFLA